MKIIDTHVHIGGEHVGFHMTESMVLEMMQDYNISYVILSNGDAAEMDHQQNLLKDQITQEAAKLFPEIPFVMIHMGLGSDAPIDGKDTYKYNPKGERSLYQDYFHVLPERIPEEAYEKLMYGNAERLFLNV